MTQFGFGEAGSIGEECIGVQFVVPEKFEKRSVKLVRARLGGYVDRSTGASTILCREGAAGGLEFLNCLHPDGIDDGTAPANRGDSCPVVLSKRHVHSIEGPVIPQAGEAVKLHATPVGACSTQIKAGLQRQQLCKCPPIQWKVANLR